MWHIVDLDLKLAVQLDEEDTSDATAGDAGSIAAVGVTSAQQAPVGQPPLHFFRPMVEWPLRYGGPPLAVNSEKEFNMPLDEARMATPSALEAAQRVSVRPKVAYPHPAAVPASPTEAPAEPALSMVVAPRSIPLSQLSPSQQPPPAQPVPQPQSAPAAQPLPPPQGKVERPISVQTVYEGT